MATDETSSKSDSESELKFLATFLTGGLLNSIFRTSSDLLAKFVIYDQKTILFNNSNKK